MGYRTATDLTINCCDCMGRISFLRVDAERPNADIFRVIVQCTRCQSKMQLSIAAPTDKLALLKGATLLETYDPKSPISWKNILKKHGLRTGT
jgi:hypothetical protein